MKEEDFKKLRTEVLRKAGLVNMSLRKKLSYTESLKVNDISEEKFNLMGWKYNKDLNQIERINYVTFNDLEEQSLDSYEEKKSISSQTFTGIDFGINMFSNDDLSQLQDFINNYKIIMQMVNIFKEHNKLDTDNNTIIIKLPFEDDKTFKASYRINKTIYQQFKEFCKKHKEFTAKDLLSQALKEFMDKYDSK